MGILAVGVRRKIVRDCAELRKLADGVTTYEEVARLTADGE